MFEAHKLCDVYDVAKANGYLVGLCVGDAVRERGGSSGGREPCGWEGFTEEVTAHASLGVQ